MKYNSITAFVPSGKDFQKSKELFLELGFCINWEADDYVGFENNGCSFVLQNYDNKEFAENFMMSVKVGDLHGFWNEVSSLGLQEKFGVKITPPKQFPWGREVNLIDPAGVCWHFTE